MYLNPRHARSVEPRRWDYWLAMLETAGHDEPFTIADVVPALKDWFHLSHSAAEQYAVAAIELIHREAPWFAERLSRGVYVVRTGEAPQA